MVARHLADGTSHLLLTDLARKYGKIYALSGGDRLIVMVSEYELIKKVNGLPCHKTYMNIS